MNARIAIEKANERVIDLIESAKKVAEVRNISIIEAIDFKVSVYEKYAKNGNEAAAWYITGEQAKEVIKQGEFNIVFNNDNSSNDKGFAMSFEKCKDYIEMFNGTNESF